MENQSQQKDQYYNLKQVLFTILHKWYWIVACMVIFSGIAYVVNYYAKPKYRLTTTLQVNRSEQNVDPLSFIYNDKNAGKSGTDERILLTSFPLVAATLSELDFTVSYYFGKRFSLQEMYQNSPIKLDISLESRSIPYGETFEVVPINGRQYNLLWEGHPENTYEFGKDYEIDKFIFSVSVTKPEALSAYNFISVKINRLSDLVNQYRNKIQVQTLSEKIINLNIVEENSLKGREFLDKLSEKIIEQDIARKRFISEKTVEFIEDQMSQNYDSIRNIEGEIKEFRNRSVAVDPASESSRIYGTIQLLKDEKANLTIAKEYYDYLTKTLQDANEDYEKLVIPASLGIADPTLNELVSRLIDMRRQVKLLLDENKSKNPILQENQLIIAELKSNILSNIQNQKKADDLKINELERRIAQNQAQLRRMPDAEFELNDITRTYNLNQNLYMMLMEKKMEAGIKFSSINSDYRVINQAYQAGVISSSPQRNYLIAILLSLIIPVGLILLVDFFDTRVKSKEAVEQLTSLPVISSVMHLEDNNQRYQLASPIMESFRNLRADIRYLGKGKKVFTFLSSISGEGKTFCSQNLAFLYSVTNQRIVWIDADLRKPKEKEEHKKSKDEGLADYLAGFSKLESILYQPDEYPNLHFIRSGSLPPNPAELLISPRMTELIEILKERFDYIFIDTPPLNLFADAMELLPLSDYNFLVVRNKVTKTPFLNSSLKIIESKKINDISLIFNDIPRNKKMKEYGAYYYTPKKKSKKPFRKKVKLKI